MGHPVHLHLTAVQSIVWFLLADLLHTYISVSDVLLFSNPSYPGRKLWSGI
jgi:hypothetical protein